ncbi:hypothetical protein ABIA00_004347 [Bradyrhizobium ottawaense]|uniref:hypothetical protein n=1 Tax=Bradyrhizobium ottawaense TaxID=931866 RepID=UPI003834EE42
MIDNADNEAVRDAALFAATNTGLFPQANTSLFRYVGIRGNAWEFIEKTLLTDTLPLSRATTLNDPFDTNPVIVNDVVTSDIFGFAEEMLRQQGQIFDLEKVVNEQGQRVSKKELEERATSLIHSLFKQRNEICHIASFTRRISSELQWSHYGDSYKGLAYHFVTRPSHNSGFKLARPVRYSLQRPIILLSEMMDHISTFQSGGGFTLRWLSFEQRCFLAKSMEWAYEEEQRIIKQGGISEISFQDRELVSIIVGPRFPQDHLERLKAILAKRQRPLKLFRAQSSPTSYAVEVDWHNNLFLS